MKLWQPFLPFIMFITKNFKVKATIICFFKITVQPNN